MEKKKAIHLSVDASNGIKDLLLQPDITTRIATSYDAYERVALQIQRDLAARGDDEVTLQVVKGLKHIDDALKLFREEGLRDIADEQNSTKTKP